MHKHFLATAALALALAVPGVVLAADQSTGAISGQHGAMSNATNASDLIGKKAYGSGGQEIGSINDLVIDNNGRVLAAVIDVGGFLGMGEHSVALNWDQLKINPGNDRVTVGMTKDQLKAAPEYRKSAQVNMPNSQQTGQTPDNSQRNGQ